MIRGIMAGLAAALAVVLAAVWALSLPAAVPARFGPDDCRRVALVDGATGAGIAGAEDMALAPDGDTLILAAHDRLDPARPNGGLFAVSLWSLGARGPATARRLDGGGGRAFRPHGIALSTDGRSLAVINRPAPGEAFVEIGPLGETGWRAERRVADPRLCRANDLAFERGGALLVTIDRADCARSIPDLLGGTGSLARIAGDGLDILRVGLDFPNGTAAGWVAETRARRLIGPGGEVLPLPDAPDNLSADGEALVVAVHPKLIRTGLWLAGWLDRAPSRILRVEPETGAVEVLYDDPGGWFSGATVGVLAGGGLVAGSARDAGLLLCEGPA